MTSLAANTASTTGCSLSCTIVMSSSSYNTYKLRVYIQRKISMVTTQTLYGYAAKQNFHSTPMESIISIHSRPGPQVSRHLDYPDWAVTVQLEYFVEKMHFIRVFECSSVCI